MPQKTKGHVRAKRGGHAEKLLLGKTPAGGAVKSAQDGGGIGTAAAKAGGDRDALTYMDTDRKGERGRLHIGKSGAIGKVRLAKRHAIAAVGGDRDPRLGGRHSLHRYGIVKADRLHDGRDRMEAVLTALGHVQIEIDLGVRPLVDPHRAPPFFFNHSMSLSFFQVLWRSLAKKEAFQKSFLRIRLIYPLYCPIILLLTL